MSLLIGISVVIGAHVLDLQIAGGSTSLSAADARKSLSAISQIWVLAGRKANTAATSALRIDAQQAKPSAPSA
jgi:hypothetical protein